MSIASLRARLNKHYKAGEGSPIIYSAEQYVVQKMFRFRTGIFSLDHALCGGFPSGRVCRIYGPFSSGKSFVCYRILKEAQDHCRQCWGPYLKEKKRKCCEKPERFRSLWVDAEGVHTPEWVEKQGVRPDQMDIIQPTYHEQALDVIEAYLAEHAVDVIVLDSLAAMPPQKELEKAVEDSVEPGLAARKNNAAFRKWVARLAAITAEVKPLILVVNQTRETMDRYVPEVQPGGKGQDFASSVDVRLQASADLTDSGKVVSLGTTIKEHGDPVARLVGFRVSKNKTAPPHRCGEFTMWFDYDPHFKREVGSVDCAEASFTYGLRYGIIERCRTGEKKPAWKYVAKIGDGEPVFICNAKKEGKHALMADEATCRALEDAIVHLAATGLRLAPEAAVEEGDDEGE